MRVLQSCCSRFTVAVSAIIMKALLVCYISVLVVCSSADRKYLEKIRNSSTETQNWAVIILNGDDNLEFNNYHTVPHDYGECKNNLPGVLTF